MASNGRFHWNRIEMNQHVCNDSQNFWMKLEMIHPIKLNDSMIIMMLMTNFLIKLIFFHCFFFEILLDARVFNDPIKLNQQKIEGWVHLNEWMNQMNQSHWSQFYERFSLIDKQTLKYARTQILLPNERLSSGHFDSYDRQLAHFGTIQLKLTMWKSLAQKMNSIELKSAVLLS